MRSRQNEHDRGRSRCKALRLLWCLTILAGPPSVLTFSSLTISVLTMRSAFAFTSKGHDIIEATAYRHLLERTNIARLSAIAGRPFSGKDALDILIAYRILDEPHDWKSGPTNDPLKSLPIVRSGNLDYILSRQFEGNSQCFHFLARSSDVYWDTTTDPTYGYPHMLYDSAYPRCVAFLTSRFEGVLNNALAARAGDHDVYSLLHSVADSYCSAHVARIVGDADSNWRILYCKVWEPTAFIPYLFHPEAERFFGGPWGHKLTDERDEDYWNNNVADSTCSIAKNPYQVDDDCLSPRGKEAVAATEELLIVLAENVLRERIYHRIDTAFEHASWNAYLAHYFAGWKGVAPARLLRPDEREWRPLFHAGIEYHPSSITLPAGAMQKAATTDRGRPMMLVRDYTADFNLDIPMGVLGPVLPGVMVDYGERQYEGGLTDRGRSTSPILRVGYSLAFEFADDFAIRMTPFEREFLLAPGHKGETRNLVSFLEIEGIIDRHFWFRAEAPRFTAQGWLPNDYGIAAGYSEGWDFGKWFSEVTGSGKPLPLAGKEWHVPSGPNTNQEIDQAKLGSGMSMSATIFNMEFNPYANQLYGISAQLLWDRNSSGERTKGFADGLELDYMLPDAWRDEPAPTAATLGNPVMLPQPEAPAIAEAGYILRYYLSPHFAITALPIEAVKPIDGTEPHPAGNFAWDCQSTLGIMALLMHTDFTLGLVRISWRDALAHKSPFYQDLPAGLRIGANFFIP